MIVETGPRAISPEMVGGRLCLELANTVNNYELDEPLDDLASYSDLVSWSREAGIISEREARLFLHKAELHPKEACAALERAKKLRAAIYQIFSGVVGQRSRNKADLAALNAALSQVLSRSQIVSTKGNKFYWEWATHENPLDALLWPVVRSAADLLTSEELSRIRECGGDNCTWLFLDTSKNRSRRWCDMKACGNRAKSRRHYQRMHSAQNRVS